MVYDVPQLGLLRDGSSGTSTARLWGWALSGDQDEKDRKGVIISVITPWQGHVTHVGRFVGFLVGGLVGCIVGCGVHSVCGGTSEFSQTMSRIQSDARETRAYTPGCLST